jgi:hypothetical protein
MENKMKKFDNQPRDKRATPQDLIGVFASVHNLKADNVEIKYDPQESMFPAPVAGSFYVDFSGNAWIVLISNRWYAALQNIVTQSYNLVDNIRFRPPFDEDTRPDDLIMHQISQMEAEDFKDRKIEEAKHDELILRDINSWLPHDKYNESFNMFVEPEFYVQLSDQMQQSKAELFVDLGERKTVKFVSTWLPQLVNKECGALLLVNEQFRKLVKAKLLYILRSPYAEKLLTLNASIDEADRLESIEQMTRTEPQTENVVITLIPDRQRCGLKPKE